MLEHRKIVNNFIHLLKTSPSLFSQEDDDELNSLIDDTPDDIKSLSNVICEWLEKHSDVDDALEKLEHPDIDDALEELDGIPRIYEITNNKPSIPDYEPDKEVLKNAIRERNRNTEDNNNTD